MPRKTLFFSVNLRVHCVHVEEGQAPTAKVPKATLASAVLHPVLYVAVTPQRERL